MKRYSVFGAVCVLVCAMFFLRSVEPPMDLADNVSFEELDQDETFEVSDVSDYDFKNAGVIDVEEPPRERESLLPDVVFRSSFGATIGDVVDTSIINEDDRVMKRSILFHSEGGLVRKDEYLEWNDELGQWNLSREIYMKGEEFAFERNPSFVSETLFSQYLMEEGLLVTWESRLSAFVQLTLSTPTIANFDRAIEKAQKMFPRAVAEPDYLYFTSDLPDDYNPSRLWNMGQVNADDAWSLETGDPSVVVAIVDTGIEVSHPDLVNNIWVNTEEIANNGLDDDNNGFIDDVNGWDFVNNDNSPNDSSSHGTHVAGTVAASGNNSQGVVGVAWTSKVMAIKAGEQETLASSAIAEGLRYVEMMKRRGVGIVATNNSYGGFGSSDSMQSIIQGQEDENILFVAASGNDGSDLDGGFAQFPAAYSNNNIISVANSSQNDDFAPSSNVGRISVDLAAPGRSIYSTIPGGGYGLKTGTSMASPLVAGAVALVASHDSSLGWREIKNRILDTVDEVSSMQGRVLSGGRLNVLAALDTALLDFDVSVKNHPGGVIFVPEANRPITLEMNMPTGSDLSANVVGGGNVDISVSDGVVTCMPKEAGAVTIRISAQLSGVSKSVDRTVLVGDVPDITNGLLHSYDFESGSNTVVDRAGGSNGTARNVTFEDVGLGKSIRFPGSDSEMKFTSKSSSQVTMMALINPDSISQNGHPRIINTPDYYIYVSSSDSPSAPDGNRNVFKFYSNRNGGDFGVWNSEPNSIGVGKWLHVAATYDSGSLTNAPSMFFNGKPRVVRTQGAPQGTQTTAGGGAFLGDREDGTRAWDGFLDEVRIYDRVLSPKEIAVVSSRYFKARWANYRLEEVTGGSVGTKSFKIVDSAGNAPNATFEWSLVDEIGSGTISQNGESEVTLDVGRLQRAVLRLSLSDADASAYFYQSIDIEPVGAKAGAYSVQLGDGSLVWAEIDPSLESGYVTIFDTDSGYFAFRKMVTIDKTTGVFSSTDSSGETLQGITGLSFVVRVGSSGRDLEASPVTAVNGMSEFVGRYSGGVLGAAESYLELLVAPNGELLLLRQGAFRDIAKSVLASTGELEVTTRLNYEYEGSFSADKTSISGKVRFDGKDKDIYLRKVGEASQSRFRNLSTRANVQVDERLMIGGFVIPKGKKRKILVRAVGPSLAAQNVQDFLEDTTLEIVKDGQVIASNLDWETSLNPIFTQVGASVFSAGSKDSAVSLDLDPGSYTALVRSQDGQSSGEALVEVYDIDNTEKALVNVSTRGFVKGTENYLIGGFVITGTEPKKVLIRGVGPSLGGKGVVDPLKNPIIELFSGNTKLTGNDNWMGTASTSSASTQTFDALTSAMSDSGAFTLEIGSNDAAMVVWLRPGEYTVQVSGVAGEEGVALIEVYDL